MKHHKKRYSRKTDKQGIHANEYQDMAIRSLDNTQKEKQKIGSARIPEKESIPGVQSVSKSHKDEAIEGNKIVIPTKDSSNNDSTPSVVDDPRTKKPDPGDLALKANAKEVPTSKNMGDIQEFNTSSAAQQMQPNPQTSHQGRASTDINSSNLDSNEAMIGESKQGTQNNNVETSSSRTQQEQDYKRKEDEKRFREENHFNQKSSLMYSMPWLQAANVWTKLYVGFTENAFMMTDYWLDLISTIWLGEDKKKTE
ncbi:MAG: hypothetical protein WB815_08850 [Nitrososphaeraceae archaeon]